MVWRSGLIYPALVHYQGRLIFFHTEKVATNSASCLQVRNNELGCIVTAYSLTLRCAPSIMADLANPRARGWRRPVILNAIILALLSGALALTTFFSGNETESFTVNYLFYAGACETTRMVNLGIHLGLNVAATLVFSSAVFAMQVLNSPTREEVDAAHAKGNYVEIGVPSLSNLLVLSKFKVIAWVVLAVFALPVHMLLNSAVFETDFHGKSWNLTIAAEPFTEGAEFFWPGASLAFPGSDEGYGRPVDYADVLSNSSQAVPELQNTSSNARAWRRLDAATCRKEYLRCNPEQEFKDVVLVINTAGEETTEGWTRREVFGGDDRTNDWDNFVPDNGLNSLWFAATCELGMRPENGPDACANSCGRVLGSKVNLENNDEADRAEENWVIPFQDRETDLAGDGSGLSREGFLFDRFNDLEVRYCLAEEFQQTCKLGVSPLMLGLSALCVAFIATQLLYALDSYTSIWELTHAGLFCENCPTASLLRQETPLLLFSPTLILPPRVCRLWVCKINRAHFPFSERSAAASH